MAIFTTVGCPDPNRFLIKNVWSNDSKDAIKAGVPGAAYDKLLKAYTAPLESFEDALRCFPQARYNPDLRVRSAEMHERHKRIFSIKELVDVPDEELVIPGLKSPNGHKLRPRQKVGVRFLQTCRTGEGGILAMDVGVGKSLTSEAYALWLFSQGLIDRVMVVCPAPLKYSVWAKELEKWTALTFMIIDGDQSMEVEVERDIEEWELDERGKRKFIYEPEYKMELVHLKEHKISKYFMDDTHQREAVMFNATAEAEQALGEKDELVSVDLDGQLIAENMEPFYYARAHIRRYKRDKKTFLKRLTGERKPVIEKWSGRKLREVQYAQDPADFRVIVNNYENFLEDVAFEDDSPSSVNKQEAACWTPDMKKTIMPFPDDRTLIILDEAHRVKNRQAKSSIRLWKWAAYAGYRVLLTANPLENNIEELYNLVNIVRPNLLGSWNQYKDRYLFTDEFGRSTGQPNPSMIPELKQKIAPIMYRVTKKEALPELPDLIELEHWVTMDDGQRALYNKIEEGILEQYNTFGETEFKYVDKLAQITRFQQCCDHTELFRRILSNEELPSESAKLKELMYILDDVGVSNHKFLIFDTYREVTDIIHRELSAVYGKFYDFIYIKGGVMSRDTGTMARKFREDPRTRFAIITTAGNYGIDLFDESGTSDGDYVINFNQHFNPQKMRQIVGRMHRGGQTKTVTAISLYVKDSYEERKKALLDAKRNVFDAVIEQGAVSDEAVMKLFTGDELAYMMFGGKGAKAGTAQAEAMRDARLAEPEILPEDLPLQPQEVYDKAAKVIDIPDGPIPDFDPPKKGPPRATRKTPEARKVVWWSEQEQRAITDYVTYDEATRLAEDLDRYDVGHVMHSGWDACEHPLDKVKTLRESWVVNTDYATWKKGGPDAQCTVCGEKLWWDDIMPF